MTFETQMTLSIWERGISGALEEQLVHSIATIVVSKNNLRPYGESGH